MQVRLKPLSLWTPSHGSGTPQSPRTVQGEKGYQVKHHIVISGSWASAYDLLWSLDYSNLTCQPFSDCFTSCKASQPHRVLSIRSMVGDGDTFCLTQSLPFGHGICYALERNV